MASNKYLYGLILLIFMIFIISCVETNPGQGTNPKPGKISVDLTNPRAAFDKYLDFAEDSDDYKIVYSSNSSMSDFDYYYSSESVKVLVGFFKKGDIKKSVLEIGMANNLLSISLIEMGNQHIVCTKGDSYMGVGSTEEYECETDEYSKRSVSEYFENYANTFVDSLDSVEDYTVKYLGQKKIIDRVCDEFEIEILGYEKMISGEEESGVSYYRDYDDSGIPDNVLMKTCLDQETGLQLTMRMLVKTDSELVDTDYLPISSMEAVKLETGIDDIDLPIKFTEYDSVVSSDELLVIINSFISYDGLATINFYNDTGYDSYYYDSDSDEKELIHSVDLGIVHLKPIKPSLFIIDHGLSAASYGKYVYEICLSDDCIEGRFSLSSYSLDSNIVVDCFKLSTDEKACNAEIGCKWNEPVCNWDYGYY